MIDCIIGELSILKHALDESIIVAIMDKSGTIRFANRKFHGISKYSGNELVKQNHRILKSGYHPLSL